MRWIYLLVNVHINFPACAEALIDEHYGDSHDRLAEPAEGMNDDGQKDDGEHAPGIPRLRVVDPASIGASSKSCTPQSHTMQLPVAPHLSTRWGRGLDQDPR